jgi:hypothetical protein
MLLPVDQVAHLLAASSSAFVASDSPAVKGAALRLASLGPVGPPLTAGPLRLDGNEGPLTRTSSEPSDQRSTDVFRQFEYPHVASQRDLAVKTKP